jgi:hypothetical protein
MAKTISQLPDATVVNGSDELIIQQSGVTKRATKTEVLAGIVNANIDANAAILGTKIAPNFGSQNVVTTGTLAAGTTQMTAPSSSIALTLIGRSSDNTAALVFDNNAGNAGSQVNYINSVPNSRLVFATNNTERMRIDASGNVGIGTSSPAAIAKLDVQGGRTLLSANSEPYAVGAKFVNTGGAVYFGAASNSATPDAVISSAGGAELMRITNGGSVVIGATSPVSEKFEVVGNIAARSNSATGAAGLYNIVNGTARSSFGVDMSAAAGAGVSYIDFHRQAFFRDTNDSYTTRLQIKPSGQVRFQPLASDPAGAEAGDVYYNSSSNKLKVYDGTSWVDLN